MSTSLWFEPWFIEREFLASSIPDNLTKLFSFVSSLTYDAQFNNHSNHLPQLDTAVQANGKAICKALGLQRANTQKRDTNLFVVSELYLTGGHSRLLDEVRSVSSRPSIIVVTDIFQHYASGIMSRDEVIKRFPNSKVYFLFAPSFIEKIKIFIDILNENHIAAIGLFTHPNDVVAYAVCNSELDIRQAFFHHADHTPSLGATIPHFTHLDYSLGNLEMCKSAGFLTPVYLPMSSGSSFVNLDNFISINSCTCGAFERKFTAYGSLALSKIVSAVMCPRVNVHFHIGEIPDYYIDIIYSELERNSVSKERFRYLPSVPTLGEFISNNGINLFLTSAPICGFKAYVDALGCGVPIIRYQILNTDMPIFNFNESYTYSGEHLSWSTLAELTYHINHINLEEESKKSRMIYDSNHNKSSFETVIQDIF
jgi:O-antigen biosynthesis protein